MKNNYLKFIMTIFLSVIISPAFTGCTGGEVKQTNEELNLLYEGDNANGYYREALAIYKKLYPDVKINLETINVDVTTEWQAQYAKKLSADVMSGKGPDVIQLDLLVGQLDSEYSVNKMMESAVFADLSKLYNNDTTLDKGDLYKNAIDAGIYNGKRYVIPSTFQVPVLVTNQMMLDKSEISLSSCDTYNSFIDETTPLIKKWQDDNSTLKCFSRNKALYIKFFNNGLRYLDFNNKAIKFNDAEFKKWMEYYKLVYSQLPPVEKSSIQEQFWIPGIDEPFAKNQIFEDMSLFSSGPYFNMGMQATDKPIIVPLFNDDGTLPIKLKNIYAVSANSNNKQNAWNFIKIMLEKNFFETQIDFLQIPVSKTAAKNNLNGFDETQKNNYLKALENTSMEAPFFDPAQNIVMDSMEPFFKGEKDYDTCLTELKDKLELYVSE